MESTCHASTIEFAGAEQLGNVFVCDVDQFDVIQSKAQMFKQCFVERKVTRLTTTDRYFLPLKSLAVLMPPCGAAKIWNTSE